MAAEAVAKAEAEAEEVRGFLEHAKAPKLSNRSCCLSEKSISNK